MCNAPKVSLQAWQESVSFIRNLPNDCIQHEPVELQHHVEIYNSYCDVQRAKQQIMAWGSSKHGDVKELINQYIYYVANRSADDKLNVGRDIHQCNSKENYTQHLKRMSERRIIFALHDYKCIMCGEENTFTNKLEIHHIEKLSTTCNRDITNMAPMCHKCHCEAHANDPTVWRN